MAIQNYPILNLILCGFYLLGAITLSAAPGDLDPTFGNGGIVVTSVADQPYWDEPRSIQLQPDGKIVVSGEILQDTDDGLRTVSFFVARYLPSGVLDSSFGTNGKIMAPIAPPYTGGELVGEEIALQRDGKIVAVGARFIGGNLYFAVIDTIPTVYLTLCLVLGAES